jgi:uncharacterized protein
MAAKTESSLVINLRDLSEGHHPLELKDQSVVLEFPEWIEAGGDVAVAGDVERRADQVIVRAKAALDSISPCARCAKPVGHILEAEIFLVSDRAGKGDASEETALEEEGSILYHDGMELSLVGPVREALILEDPLSLLCTPDCKGLCAQCGQDLNVESCSCPPPEGDSRWGVLKSITDKDT